MSLIDAQIKSINEMIIESKADKVSTEKVNRTVKLFNQVEKQMRLKLQLAKVTKGDTSVLLKDL